MGPELVEANTRGLDTWENLYGIAYFNAGKFSEFIYGPWPGFFYLGTILENILAIGEHQLATLISISQHLLLLVAILLFSSSIFKEKKSILLATLMFEGLLWPIWSLAPFIFGFTLFILFFSVLFNPNLSVSRKRIPLIVLFAGILISHGLSALMAVLYVILFVTINRLVKTHLTRFNDVKLAVFCVASLIGWLLYSSTWVLNAEINSFLLMLRDPLGIFTAHYTTNLTPVRESVINLTYFFYAFLLVWLIIIIARREFLSKLNLERILPILLLIPLALIPFTGAYASEGIQRFYFVSTPFLAWFFIKESRSKKRVTICFLILLLTLSFFMRYSAEYVNLVQTSDFAGSTFTINTIPPNNPPAFYASWRPSISTMANIFPPFHIYNFEELISYKTEGTPLSGNNFVFLINSTFAINQVFYYYGEDMYNKLTANFFSSNLSMLYNNGDFVIYASK